MVEPKNIRLAKNKKRRSSTFSRFVFYFVSVGFLGVIVYALFFSPFLAISSVEMKGNRRIERSAILDLIRPQISGKIFEAVDKNNLFLVRNGKMERTILERFKLIRSAKIKKKFPSVLMIDILERIPMLAVCESRCFILDENGQAYDNFEPSLDETQKYDLIRLISQSERDINLGDTVLDRDYMNYLLNARKKLTEDLGFGIENDFWTPTIISNDIRVKTKEGWSIYFNREIEIAREIEILKVIIGEKIGKDQRADLEYIDIRIDNKVFYKFRDGTASENARIAEREASQVPEGNAPSANSANEKDKKKKD